MRSGQREATMWKCLTTKIVNDRNKTELEENQSNGRREKKKKNNNTFIKILTKITIENSFILWL